MVPATAWCHYIPTAAPIIPLGTPNAHLVPVVYFQTQHKMAQEPEDKNQCLQNLIKQAH